MDIAGRNAVVTGGATRVGRALTLALAGAGADVFIHYNSSAGPAEKTAADVEAVGRKAAIGSANLSDPSVTGDLIAQATAALGPISILVNSASGFPADTLADATLDGFHSALNLSLASPIFLTQAFAAALPDEDEGAVVNVTDVKTQRPYKDHFSYVIAKGGIDTFTRAAARFLAPQIRVNAVALGVILPPPGEDDFYAEQLASKLPLKRVGGTEPVAAAMLAVLENDFITGEIVRVDGGGHLE
ncbi:MAG: SDR family oxidoreductase [Acidimicrobiia bacterium]|nr:SDR family oxidoreductase [Acidimicrobiia bacterium]